MRTRTLATALSVVGALFALSACETPSMDDFNSLRNQVANLESRVSAAEARADEAAAAAAECRQVCERTDRMFQQSLRK